MCLQIPFPFKNPTKPIIVYKFYKGNGLKTVFHSPYINIRTVLRTDRFVNSDRSKVNLSEGERQRYKVQTGLHGFTRIREAKACMNKRSEEVFGQYRLTKFVGYPVDFVASGRFNYKKSVVYTRLKFVEFVK